MRPKATIGFALLAGILLSGPVQAADPQFLRIGTGGIGGTYFPVGGLIANAISSPPGSPGCDLGGSCGVPGLVAAAVSTQGSVENAQLVAARKLGLGLCQADIALETFAGKGRFAGKALANLRAIANLYTEQLHVVTRTTDPGVPAFPGIASLQGRPVSIGEPESGTRVTALAVLAAYDVDPRKLQIVSEPIDAASDLLVAGKIDALLMVGGYPMQSIADAAERIPIALLPIAGDVAIAFRKENPYYVNSVIPANTYRNVPRTPTIGVGALLIVAAETDEDLVFKITRALWDPRNQRIFDASKTGTARFSLDGALVGLSIPIHPGAARYYGEIGLRPVGEY